MVSCGEPGCTNRADKNSNIIALYNVVIAISWYIQNLRIFNTESTLKTLSNINDDEAY